MVSLSFDIHTPSTAICTVYLPQGGRLSLLLCDVNARFVCFTGELVGSFVVTTFLAFLNVVLYISPLQKCNQQSSAKSKRRSQGGIDKSPNLKMFGLHGKTYSDNCSKFVELLSQFGVFDLFFRYTVLIKKGF